MWRSSAPSTHCVEGSQIEFISAGRSPIAGSCHIKVSPCSPSKTPSPRQQGASQSFQGGSWGMGEGRISERTNKEGNDLVERRAHCLTKRPERRTCADTISASKYPILK